METVKATCAKHLKLSQLSDEQLERKRNTNLTVMGVLVFLSITLLTIGVVNDNIAIGFCGIGMLAANTPHFDELDKINKERKRRKH